MTARCRSCRRRLLRPSPDGYGPVCRRRAQPPVPPAAVVRVTSSGPIPNQLAIPIQEEPMTNRRVPALTVRPPWSVAIAHGHKTVENRSWPTKYRGPLLIHEGKTVDRTALHHPAFRAFAATFPPGTTLGDVLHPGCIVAAVDLTGCHPDDDRCTPWSALGQWHWELPGVRPLPEPVPCRGALGLWTPPEDVLAAVTAQLAAA